MSDENVQNVLMKVSDHNDVLYAVMTNPAGLSQTAVVEQPTAKGTCDRMSGCLLLSTSKTLKPSDVAEGSCYIFHLPLRGGGEVMVSALIFLQAAAAAAEQTARRK